METLLTRIFGVGIAVAAIVILVALFQRREGDDGLREYEQELQERADRKALGSAGAVRPLPSQREVAPGRGADARPDVRRS